jgi:hypothetical protein
VPIDATKKYREPLAFGLLAVSVLWFVGSLSLLLKSTDIGFATKSAYVGGLFESPITVGSVVVAVLLVTRYGEPSRNARVVVLAALGIGGLDLLFAIICFFAQFGSDIASGFEGIGGAGKGVGAILGLAALIFLAVAELFVFTALQGLPAPVSSAANPWGGSASGYAGPQAGAAGGQSGWARPDPAAGYGSAQGSPGYGQASAYPTPGQGSVQPGGWGQPAQDYSWTSRPGDPGGWGAQAGQPQSSGWSQFGTPPGGRPEQPTSVAWGQAAQPQTAGSSGSSSWPADDAGQQGQWIQPAPTPDDGAGNGGEPSDTSSWEGLGWGESPGPAGGAADPDETRGQGQPVSDAGSWASDASRVADRGGQIDTPSGYGETVSGSPGDDVWTSDSAAASSEAVDKGAGGQSGENGEGARAEGGTSEESTDEPDGPGQARPFDAGGWWQSGR